MKLGISTTLPHDCPEEWARLHRELGLEAVVFPRDGTAPVSEIDAYKRAADDAGLCIAEVGAWCNPLAPDPAVREENIRKCIRQLELAEYVGALCCVNIAGAKGDVWDGSYAENYSERTYTETVECVRRIVDAVQPKRTAYTLEPMPHMLPDSPEIYLQMLRDIDRPGFGVHLDLVNLIISPRDYFGNRALTDRCFALLGPYIKSCHLKDAILDHSLTVSIRETVCGKGGIDLAYYLQKADACNIELPMILEHLPTPADYKTSAVYIRKLYRDSICDRKEELV